MRIMHAWQGCWWHHEKVERNTTERMEYLKIDLQRFDGKKETEREIEMNK